MKTAPSSLSTFLASAPGQIWKAEIYTITLPGGSVIYLTGADRDIVAGGHTYTSLGPYLTMKNCKQSIGFSVDSVTLDILADPTHQINSVPFIQAAGRGILDGATVLIERYIGATPGDLSYGKYIKFAGFVSNITNIGNASCSIEVKPKTEKLNQNMPRNLVQPGCRFTLFDTGCTLNKASFVQNGTVTSGSTVVNVHSNLTQASSMSPPNTPTVSAYNPGSGVNIPAKTYFVVVTYVNALGETIGSTEVNIAIPDNQVVKVTSPSSASGATGWNVYIGESSGGEVKQNTSPIAIGTDYTMPNSGPSAVGAAPPSLATDGYFAQGWVEFTSGANNGVARMVTGYSSGVFSVLPGLPFTPNAGDTFHIYPGCDKQQPTCSGKFNNLINFGGFPYVPTPDIGL